MSNIEYTLFFSCPSFFLISAGFCPSGEIVEFYIVKPQHNNNEVVTAVNFYNFNVVNISDFSFEDCGHRKELAERNWYNI